ncbi:MAG TPA: hypothetical protein VL907_09270 [Pyrinomonadaceae bacterium]|jgi:hypothetical protein|nr:hypothetical protein [Pyrinomonadaceae bacterium]
MHTSKFRTVILLALVFCLSAINVGVAAKSKKKKQAPQGTPVLWERPTDISSRDLFLGPGGTRMRPDLRRITFLKEEKGGYSKKYRVRDASGREWVAKIGKEAQSETSAIRLLWGLGYQTEVNYLVPRVTIPGKGTFTNVRFEARPEEWDRVGEWKWKRNPFLGTPEYQGLKIMMAMINNWDLKDSNNETIQIGKGSDAELRYIISDLGATFGHASTTPLFWRFTRSRNNPSNYANSKFFEKVKGNRVVLHFGGKNSGLMKDITVSDAQWLSSWLSQLSDQQLRDAFRAANYRPDEINLLAREIRERSTELLNLRPAEQIGRLR